MANGNRKVNYAIVVVILLIAILLLVWFMNREQQPAGLPATSTTVAPIQIKTTITFVTTTTKVVVHEPLVLPSVYTTLTYVEGMGKGNYIVVPPNETQKNSGKGVTLMYLAGPEDYGITNISNVKENLSAGVTLVGGKSQPPIMNQPPS
ncbi:Uncharacterised protein [uncultured archaeon]|nr:Uncharacterised protein [uncultured archaeon]